MCQYTAFIANNAATGMLTATNLIVPLLYQDKFP